jgi:hypothetical protein
MTKELSKICCLGFSLFAGVHFACAQGNLTPPGAPAATMKSLSQIDSHLSQVEPRTPISSLPFDIINPGSYYLTTNLTGPSGYTGIVVDTNNVTIDLNGFYLLGATGTFHAISIPSTNTANITVRNGTIGGWSGGYAISSFGRNMTVEHLTVFGCYSGATVGAGSVVRDCLFYGNNQNGLNVNGPGCMILNNDFYGNNAANVAGNASIAVQDSNNRIEGNHVTATGAAGRGISINAGSVTNNLVIRNSVIGGGANNYSFNTLQIVGPLVTTTVSGVITNSNPWANFSY